MTQNADLGAALDKLRRYAATRDGPVTLTDDEAVALLDQLERDRPDIGFT